MNVEEVIKEVPEYEYTPIWYKYDGHGGFQPPEEGWNKDTSCFSTVCRDETKTLCKIGNPRPDITERQWKIMVGMVKRVSKDVRKCLQENPPSFKEHTMMFNSGHGYSDYFAFTIWRLFYKDWAMFKVFQFLHKTHKYSLADAYILTGLFQMKNWWEGNHYTVVTKMYQNSRIRSGVAKRLKNASRYRNIHPYGMKLAMNGHKGQWMNVIPKNLTESDLNDTAYMDRIVEHINS